MTLVLLSLLSILPDRYYMGHRRVRKIREIPDEQMIRQFSGQDGHQFR